MLFHRAGGKRGYVQVLHNKTGKGHGKGPALVDKHLKMCRLVLKPENSCLETERQVLKQNIVLDIEEHYFTDVEDGPNNQGGVLFLPLLRDWIEEGHAFFSGQDKDF